MGPVLSHFVCHVSGTANSVCLMMSGPVKSGTGGDLVSLFVKSPDGVGPSPVAYEGREGTGPGPVLRKTKRLDWTFLFLKTEWDVPVPFVDSPESFDDATNGVPAMCVGIVKPPATGQEVCLSVELFRFFYDTAGRRWYILLNSGLLLA